MRISFILVMGAVGCTPMASTSPQAPSPPAIGESTAGDVPRIPVTTDQSCPASAAGCDILEVVDLHTSATSEDKGFDELRRRAAAEGGDAVIGAEFEHGDPGEQSHLSGMVVRYADPIPPHEDLGEIDIPSDEDSEDKGLAELSRRGHAMGGDRVIKVTFEHGDNGAKGHLRGTVIRVTR